MRPSSSPFARLALTHALSLAGEACIAVALAGTLFFSVPAADARPKVALYLLLTLAPFTIVGPLLGPALDRTAGGRRLMVVASGAIRAALCILMARHVDSLFLYPESFGVLVVSKGYTVAKSALIPAVVEDREALVEANSRLVLIGVLSGFAAALPAAGAVHFLGASWPLGMAAALSAMSAVAALRIPTSAGERAPLSSEARRGMHSASVLLAVSGMSLLRGSVGFTTFLLAFSLKRMQEDPWYFGVVLAAASLGGFFGALIAPALRRRLREELMLAGSLIVPAVPALMAARDDSRIAIVVVAFTLGVGAAAGKLAFDSLVQRDAPDAMRARSFAQFETRLQIAWALGAATPVLIPLALRLGFLVLALALTFAGVSYFGSTRISRRTRGS